MCDFGSWKSCEGRRQGARERKCEAASVHMVGAAGAVIPSHVRRIPKAFRFYFFLFT
jgi:hypothetical protein